MATLEFPVSCAQVPDLSLLSIDFGFYGLLCLSLRWTRNELAASQDSLHFTTDFFYCHTEMLFKSADVILLFEAGIKALVFYGGPQCKSTQCDIFIVEVSLFCFSVGSLHRRASVYTHTTSRWFENHNFQQRCILHRVRQESFKRFQCRSCPHACAPLSGSNNP